MNIDQSAMCYISMDLTHQALQTNGKLFFKFRIPFSNKLATILKIIPRLYGGFMHARWGSHLC